MKLHEAIEAVLRREDRNLSALEIADYINLNKMYEKKDGSEIQSFQIRLRAKNYPDLFLISNDFICLKNSGTVSQLLYLAKSIKEVLSYEIGDFDANGLFINTWFLFLRGFDLKYFKAQNYELDVNDLLVQIESFLTFNGFDSDEIEVICSSFKSTDKYIFKNVINLTNNFYPQNKSITQTEFNDFYSKLVAGNSNLRGMQIVIPNSLKQLIGKFIKNNVIEGSVYDPFSTSSSILPDLINQFGNKNFISLNTYSLNYQALIHLNLLAYNISNFEISNLNIWSVFRTERFDNIITIPPFGQNLKQFERVLKSNPQLFKFGYSPKVETMALQIVLNNLSSKGRAIVLLPEGTLVSSDSITSSIKKELVDLDRLEAIISLPNDLFFPYSSIKTSLVIINNEKRNNFKDKVLFYSLDSNNIEINKIDLDKSLIEVSNSDLRKGDYKLNYNSQLPKIKIDTNERIVKLGDVISNKSLGLNVSREYLNDTSGIPFINIKDLQSDNATPIFNINNVKLFIEDLDDLQNNKAWKVKDSFTKGTILIARNGNALKASLIDKDIEVLCSNNVLAFKVNEQIALPGYILSQLRSDYVVSQINSIRGGAVIPFLSLENLLNVQIVLPTLEEQAVIERNFLFHQFENISFSDEKTFQSKKKIELIGTVKHEFGNLRRPLEEDLLLLKDFFKDKIKSQASFKVEETITRRPNSRKVFDVFTSMQEKLNEMGNLLEDIQILINIENSELEKSPIDVEYFFKEIFEEYDSKFFVFSVNHVKKLLVNNDYFKKVIRNLIENTIKHGFEGKPIDKCIQIEVDFDNIGNVVIDFKNSGKSFDDDFNYDKYITFGYKSGNNHGTGIGGHLINQIIIKHGGTFKLINKDNIHFQIIIPIK
jgi:signal transduction histidine kinase